ncbi:MAG: hypothetical protein ACREML_06440 [Vulcanimicrobiaceae bacterium]
MISIAKPPPHRTAPALALSIALHVCALGLLAAVVPLWHITVNGYGFRGVATLCAAPCGRVFAIRIEHRAHAAATEGIKRIAQTLLPSAVRERSVPAQRPVPAYRKAANAMRTAPEDAAAETAQLVTTGMAGTNPNASLATPVAQAAVSAARLQPNSISANPSNADTPPVTQSKSIQAQTGPANWGSHFDKPTLLDRALYDDVVAKLPKRATITIAVDDHGRATDVRIDAPGLDPAAIADLRARLLAATYAAVERDGITFEGTLTISSFLAH